MVRRILTTIFAALLASCAYNYAGQEGKTRSEPPEVENVKVVEVKDADAGTDGSTDGLEEAKTETKPQSPCGTPSFEIHYYTDSTQVTKTVDCEKRSVIDVQKTPMGETTFADAKAAGLPVGSWYILVDPKGVRAKYLNNAQLLKLSRQFKIEYFGRDASRDLLVYLYQDDPK